MTYEDFLARVIKDGLEEVQEIYKDQPNKLKGCISGFKCCEHCTPRDLGFELKKAKGVTAWMRTGSDHDRYWRARMKEAQIEFVCSVVSALLMNEGKPIIITPTASGVLKASAILETHLPF